MNECPTDVKYTHFLPNRYVMLRVFNSGRVDAIPREGATRSATGVEIQEMRTQRKDFQYSQLRTN